MPIADGVLTITPEEIVITDHLWDAFGHYETEISADWLVRFAQKRGKGWRPFTYAEIEEFYSAGRGGTLRGFSFNKLVDKGFIIMVPKGTVGTEGSPRLFVPEDTYHYTEDFIGRCFRAAAKK